MRKYLKLLACALVSGFAFAGPALADGGGSKGAFVARPPSGPTDSKLFGKESAPSGDAASNSAPPTATAPLEEATPIAPVQTQELAATTQSAPSGPPLWNSRWFWALLALLLLLAAGAVEYFGRKSDEALAADEPDDAPLKA